MKKIAIYVYLGILTSCLSCKDSLVLEKPKFNQKPITTEQEAKSIAAKYGYNDIDMIKYSALLYMNKNEIEKYFQGQSYYRSVGEERRLFKKEVKNITSVDGYIALIDKYPNHRKAIVDSYKGEDNYQKWVKEMRSEPHHIYINDSSVVYLCPARLDNIKRGEKTNFGKRVDNLKD